MPAPTQQATCRSISIPSPCRLVIASAAARHADRAAVRHLQRMQTCWTNSARSAGPLECPGCTDRSEEGRQNRLCNVRHSERRAEQQSNKRAEMRQSAARLDERYQPKREQNISDRLGLSPSSPCPLPPLPIHGVLGFWWSSACLGFPGPCAPRACSLLPLPFLASEMSICADQVNRGRRKGKRSWK